MEFIEIATHLDDALKQLSMHVNGSSGDATDVTALQLLEQAQEFLEHREYGLTLEYIKEVLTIIDVALPAKTVLGLLDVCAAFGGHNN